MQGKVGFNRNGGEHPDLWHLWEFQFPAKRHIVSLSHVMTLIFAGIVDEPLQSG